MPQPKSAPPGGWTRALGLLLAAGTALSACAQAAGAAGTSPTVAGPATPSARAASPGAGSPRPPSATATASPASATPTSAPAALTVPAGAIVVDHTSLDLFPSIPESYLEAAAGTAMFFMDRSVGFNIDSALDCLAFDSAAAAPNRCSRWRHVVPEFSADPADSGWSRPGGYDRSRWLFQTWPEDRDCSYWSQEVGCFLSVMEASIDRYDVVSYQFSYLEVAPGSDIAADPGGFFSDNPDRLDVYDLQAYQAQHPDQVFIYWTTSLARGIGSPESVRFNEQMRRYAVEHGQPLFDVADILSHDPHGAPCYDNRDGRPYDNGNQAEDYPDDGQDLAAICPHYTTEVDGGHLGSVSTGSIRVAKAFWVLMAQIAGWRP